MEKINEIYLLVGPSGAGKDYLICQLKLTMPDIFIVPSYTTRAPRIKEGVKKYHFVTDKEFEKAWRDGKILEKVVEHGHSYGTDKQALDKAIERGSKVLGNVETNGARVYKEIYGESVKTIYIDPGSIEEIEERIRNDKNRVGQSEDEIQTRLAKAKKEMAFKGEADFVIENRDGMEEQAVRELIQVVSGIM